MHFLSIDYLFISNCEQSDQFGSFETTPSKICLCVCMYVCLSVFYFLLDHWRDRNEIFRGRRLQPLDGYYVFFKNPNLLQDSNISHRYEKQRSEKMEESTVKEIEIVCFSIFIQIKHIVVVDIIIIIVIDSIITNIIADVTATNNININDNNDDNTTFAATLINFLIACSRLAARMYYKITF